MPSAFSPVAPRGLTHWFARGEAWLDARGKKAWIAAMVVSFIVFWPLGLGILAYMIWSNRMFSRSSCANRSVGRSGRFDFRATTSSGNSAFDSYKADMLRRLESEQTAFETFLQRLRDAKDKSEFDAFMEDRAKTIAPETPNAPRAGDY
jgi:hypothetical protein